MPSIEKVAKSSQSENFCELAVIVVRIRVCLKAAAAALVHLNVFGGWPCKFSDTTAGRGGLNLNDTTARERPAVALNFERYHGLEGASIEGITAAAAVGRPWYRSDVS
jgi:hypothetical protein